MKNIDLKQIQQFGGLELLARQVVEGFITGLHKSPLHGFSVEFAEHRQYNKGESTRHIDWKLLARTEKLFVKRYEEETNLRCQIVMDHSSSMYYPEDAEFNKLEFSTYAAASLVHLLRKQRDAVGLSVFSEGIELHTPAKSSSVHHKFLFNELEKLMASTEKKKNTLAVNALHEIAENIHKRSLVMIFSDMMDNSENSEDELFSALQHLRHNKHEVILFHVTDKKTELDFQFENRPYTFVDTESGEEVKVHPNRVKETYVKSIHNYKKELKLRCTQYHIDFVEADISEGFEQVLKSYLIKRSRLY
ncbi:MAG: DUF58 domain-containing protein [Bacteroidetes bacterium]|nr:MAG: DUF58 domain-containing protein [Bacteroidota bacterium]